jgi:hypothetical protein
MADEIEIEVALYAPKHLQIVLWGLTDEEAAAVERQVRQAVASIEAARGS